MSLFKKHHKEVDKVTSQNSKQDSVVKQQSGIKLTSSSKNKAKRTVNFSAQTKQDLPKGKLSYRVLMHPLMTEKINLQSAFNQYTFMVSERANKIEIKQAISETYGIMPLKIRIINMRGKAVSSGRGRSVYRKSWKKAIITLPVGKKIDIYEGV